MATTTPEAPASTTEAVDDGLTDKQRDVRDFVRAFDGSRTDAITAYAEKNGVTRSAASQQVLSLVKRGELENVNGPRGRRSSAKKANGRAASKNGAAKAKDPSAGIRKVVAQATSTPFKQQLQDRSDELTTEIASAHQSIEDLTARIAELAAERAKVAGAIGSLG